MTAPLAATRDATIPQTCADWLGEEPFTLVLSAGFFGFYAHTGLVLALEEAGLRPTRLAGASAGALVAGLWAAGLSGSDLRRELAGLRRSDFWDPGLPIGGLLKGRRFQAVLERLLAPTGVTRVEQTPTPFAAVVFDVLRRRTRALEDGPLPDLIRASCAVPFMFRPVRHGRSFLVDGGVRDRPGLSAIRPGERVVLHHLIPHDHTRHRPVPTNPQGPTLVIPDLPAVNPFQLERGLPALEAALEHSRRWLAAPLGSPPVASPLDASPGAVASTL